MKISGKMKPFIPVAFIFAFIACVVLIQQYWVTDYWIAYAVAADNENLNSVTNNSKSNHKYVLESNESKSSASISSTDDTSLDFHVFNASESSALVPSASISSGVESSGLDSSALESSDLDNPALESSDLNRKSPALDSSDRKSSALVSSDRKSSAMDFSGLELSDLDSATLKSSVLDFSDRESSLDSLALELSDLDSATLKSTEFESSVLKSSGLDSSSLDYTDHFVSKTHATKNSDFNPRLNRAARIIDTEKSPILKALKNFWLEPLSDLPSSQNALKRAGDFPIFESVSQQNRFDQQPNQMSSHFWKNRYTRLKLCIDSCLKIHDCNQQVENSPLSTSNTDATKVNKNAFNLSVANSKVLKSESLSDNIRSGESNIEDNPKTSGAPNSSIFGNSILANESAENISANPNLSKSTTAGNASSKQSDLIKDQAPVDNPIYKVFQNFWFQAFSPIEIPEVEVKQTSQDITDKSDLEENVAIEESVSVPVNVDSCTKETLSLKESNTLLRSCQNDFQACVKKCIVND